MSILQSPEAVPQAIYAAYRLLHRRPSSYADMLALLAPHEGTPYDESVFASGEPVVKAAVGEALGMQLFTGSGDLLRLADPPPSDALDGFRRRVRQLILTPDSTQPEFCGALAWFMQRDAYSAPPQRDFSEYQRDHPELRAEVGILNSTQWDNFQRWAVFLGFAERALVGTGKAKRSVLLPDPTPALRDAWGDVTAGLPAEVGARQLVQALAATLPVLDFGPLAFPGARASRGDSSTPTLSSALSLALLTLEADGLLTFQARSDTDKVTLSLPDHAQRAVSHATLRRGITA